MAEETVEAVAQGEGEEQGDLPRRHERWYSAGADMELVTVDGVLFKLNSYTLQSWP